MLKWCGRKMVPDYQQRIAVGGSTSGRIRAESVFRGSERRKIFRMRSRSRRVLEVIDSSTTKSSRPNLWIKRPMITSEKCVNSRRKKKHLRAHRKLNHVRPRMGRHWDFVVVPRVKATAVSRTNLRLPNKSEKTGRSRRSGEQRTHGRAVLAKRERPGDKRLSILFRLSRYTCWASITGWQQRIPILHHFLERLLRLDCLLIGRHPHF